MPPDESSLELFPSERSERGAPAAPLAERMRPRQLDEMIGQPQLLAPSAGLRALTRAGALPSLILWGPPGSGKTTIARLLAEEVRADLARIVRRAAADARGLGGRAAIGEESVAAIAHAADGDARRALGLLETAAAIAGDGGEVTLDAVREAVGRRTLLHDRDREEHYNLASAFIKSLRASDPDAALYYAARMLAAGDDLLFLARRLAIFA